MAPVERQEDAFVTLAGVEQIATKVCFIMCNRTSSACTVIPLSSPSVHLFPRSILVASPHMQYTNFFIGTFFIRTRGSICQKHRSTYRTCSAADEKLRKSKKCGF